MTIETFCTMIDLPYESVLNGQQYCPDEEHLRRLFDEDVDTFFETIEAHPHTCEFVLYLFAKWGAEIYDKYQELGIPDQVFRDTFYDFTIWYHCCVRDYGIKGIKQYDWVFQAIKMEIFRLGRLQFEPFALEDDIPEKGLKKGAKLLAVHIPEGSSLDPAVIQDAFDQSQTFFPKYFDESYHLYHCESWLLSPTLPKIVSSESNIMKFKERFYVYEEDFSFRQAEERVFLDVKKDLSEYPEETSLQRSLKAFLLNGGAIGLGKGIIQM